MYITVERCSLLATSPKSSVRPSAVSSQIDIEDGQAETAHWYLDAYGSFAHGYRPARHHRVWVEALERTISSAGRRKLLLLAPPGHAKSTWISQIFISWYLGRHPDESLLFFTSSDERAKEFLGVVKHTLADNPAHTRAFPGPDCRPDMPRGWSGDGLYLRGLPKSVKDPNYRAMGYGASVIGARAHGIVLDDPLSQKDAQSESVQASAKAYYDMTVNTRLHPGGWVVAIMTRWHERDLASHLASKADWDVLNLPAISATGEALWPERFPIEALEAERLSMGSAQFACVYQGDPTAMGSTVFRREWFVREPVQDGARWPVFQFWDTAFTKERQADYSVCTTWRVEPGCYRLLDVWRDRVEFPRLKAAAVQLAASWRPQAVVVEDIGAGKSLVQDLKNETRVPFLTYRPDRDKVSRAHAVSALVEGGKVRVPVEAPWIGVYLDELCAFPSSLHDDQVDSTTMALAVLGVYNVPASRAFQNHDFRMVA